VKPKGKKDWIQELCDKGEIQIKDAKQFFDQIDRDKMITMTTDGGANPNPGPAGWGVLVRQNGKFVCLWKHYPRSSNNVMEISAVIAGLNYLPAGMTIWLSTGSQYVQKGVNEWMPKWKKNGWRNSKKAGIANKSLWLGLESAVARHRRVEFTWVKAHSGILHNEVADTLATRGVKGGSYCPVSWFDNLPEDTETEDDPNIPQTEVITQTDEFGADEEHLPQFGTMAVVYGFNEEEAAESREERERSFQQFAHDQLGNSSAQESEDEGLSRTGETLVIRQGWSADLGPDRSMNLSALEWRELKVPMEDEAEQEQSQDNECHIRVRRGIGEEEITDARSAWSNTWAQAQAEARQAREMEERFSWMREADKGMLSLGLEPYPPDQFAEAIANSGETEFMVFEQRGNGADVLRESCPVGAEVVVGATLVIRSRTCVTAMNAVSHIAEAPRPQPSY
jgi:ribonuclease HI